MTPKLTVDWRVLFHINAKLYYWALHWIIPLAVYTLGHSSYNSKQFCILSFLQKTHGFMPWINIDLCREYKVFDRMPYHACHTIIFIITMYPRNIRRQVMLSNGSFTADKVPGFMLLIIWIYYKINSNLKLKMQK